MTSKQMWTRLAGAGFLFFLIKGLVWLALLGAAAAGLVRITN